MSQPERAKIRKRLEQEVARVNDEIVAIRKEPRAQELEGFGDNTPLSEDIDAISVTEEKELQALRLDELVDRAAELDEAMHRVDQGVYGVCVSCGAKISAERLKAVPEAARCTDCESDFERKQPKEEPSPAEWRSVEEDEDRRKEFEEERYERPPHIIED